MESNQLQTVIEQGFKDLRDELETKFEKIDGRFEQIDGRFEQIDGRFEKIDERFEKIDERFEKIDTRFEKIDTRFAKIEGQLDGLRAEVRAVGDDTRRAHVQIENLRHDLHIFDEGTPTLEQRVSALEVRMTNITPKRTRKKER